MKTTLNRNLAPLLSFLSLVALLQTTSAVPSESTAPGGVQREAWAMGTRVRIVAEGPDEEEAARASEVALSEIERLERMLSTWDPSSELSRINAAPAGVPLGVPQELRALLAEAEVWARRTDRAFDPMLGSLVDAWGLRGRGRAPDDAELALARSRTGSSILQVRDGVAIRTTTRSWIDAGGFGKGAALRSAARALKRTRAQRVVIDLGGQVLAWAPNDAPWSVEVAHPVHRLEPVARLEVAGASVATSGTSERPNHLLDPRTGRPAPAWGSVTVVSADPLEADILATALYVMGPDEGLAWASARPHVAALFLRLSDRSVHTSVNASWTHEMERWLVEPPREGALSDSTLSDEP